ncbi:MAG TPA: mycofactocin-associated electron transfer flavoprotein alpha subunit, partial [Ilumatobacteraceae bacterium]|nr:mycofactocin-associated electron transfer flavoprotein alpha subunit [Ilumatobacteraceae bacterium]
EALVDTLRRYAVVILPGSADGRDLAPRLAAALGRELHGGATRIQAQRIDLVRRGGTVMQTITPTLPFVATLVPGVRGVAVTADAEAPRRITLSVAVDNSHADAESVQVLAPDASTMDLAESPRIVGGGGGLDHPDRFATLDRVARSLGASVGATRVVTDRGWVRHERQIGTTGVVVDPQLYVALAISGAVQHTAGLGHPEHIIAVNTDPFCPMMQMADLAIVSDANAVVNELATALADRQPVKDDPMDESQGR